MYPLYMHIVKHIQSKIDAPFPSIRTVLLPGTRFYTTTTHHSSSVHTLKSLAFSSSVATTAAAAADEALVETPNIFRMASRVSEVRLRLDEDFLPAPGGAVLGLSVDISPTTCIIEPEVIFLHSTGLDLLILFCYMYSNSLYRPTGARMEPES